MVSYDIQQLRQKISDMENERKVDLNAKILSMNSSISELEKKYLEVKQRIKKETSDLRHAQAFKATPQFSMLPIQERHDYQTCILGMKHDVEKLELKKSKIKSKLKIQRVALAERSKF